MKTFNSHSTPPQYGKLVCNIRKFLLLSLATTAFCVPEIGAADLGKITGNVTKTEDCTATQISTPATPSNMSIDLSGQTLTLKPAENNTTVNAIKTNFENTSLPKDSPNKDTGILSITANVDISGYSSYVVTIGKADTLSITGNLSLHDMSSYTVIDVTTKGNLSLDGDLNIRDISTDGEMVIQLEAQNTLRANNIFIKDVKNASEINMVSSIFTAHLSSVEICDNQKNYGELSIINEKDSGLFSMGVQLQSSDIYAKKITVNNLKLTKADKEAYGIFAKNAAILTPGTTTPDYTELHVNELVAKNISAEQTNCNAFGLYATGQTVASADSSGNTAIDVENISASNYAVGINWNTNDVNSKLGKISISNITSTSGQAAGLIADDVKIENGLTIKGISGNADSVAIEAQTATGSTNGGVVISAANEDVINVIEGNLSAIKYKDNTQDLDGKIDASFVNSSSYFKGIPIIEDGLTESGTINLTFKNNAQWYVTDSADLPGTLSLDGGLVYIDYGSDKNASSYAGKTLTVDTLSGAGGTIYLGVDVAKDTEDTTDQFVATTSGGAHKLYVTNVASGVDPTSEAMDTYLAKVEDSGATFSLANTGEKVEAGTYYYRLASRAATSLTRAATTGTEYYLYRAEEITPSADAAINYSGMYYQTSQWLADLETLRDRMGEIRYSDDADLGVWARVIGTRERFAGMNGRTLSATTTGIQFGFDKKFGAWAAGAAVKVADASQKVTLESGASKADADTYSGTLYATYLAENDSYLDLVFGWSHASRDLAFRQLDGTAVDGDFTSDGYGFSAEVGRQYRFKEEADRHWFIEPQLQLSYYRVEGGHYSFSNGMEIERDVAHSVIGRVGVSIGKTYLKSDGRFWQFDLKLGVKHEFAGDETVYVNGNRFDGNLGDTRGYLGLGLNWKPSDRFRYFTNVTTERGHNYRRDISFNAGVRYEF